MNKQVDGSSIYSPRNNLNPRKGIRMCYKATHGFLGQKYNLNNQLEPRTVVTARRTTLLDERAKPAKGAFGVAHGRACGSTDRALLSTLCSTVGLKGAHNQCICEHDRAR